MNWTQIPPGEEGLFLRVNAGHRVCMEHVKLLDGELRILWGWCGWQGFTPVSEPRVSEGWWWFGPIPQPPKEAM